jgi:hypothetical protein
MLKKYKALKAYISVKNSYTSYDQELDQLLIKTHGPEYSLLFKASVTQELIDFLNNGAQIKKSSTDKKWKKVQGLKAYLKKSQKLSNFDKELDELLIKTHGQEYSLFYTNKSRSQEIIDFIQTGGTISKSKSDHIWQKIQSLKRSIISGSIRTKEEHLNLESLLITTHGPEFSLFYKDISRVQSIKNHVKNGLPILRTNSDPIWKKCQGLKFALLSGKVVPTEKHNTLNTLLVENYGPKYSLFYKVSLAQELINYIKNGGVLTKSSSDIYWQKCRSLQKSGLISGKVPSKPEYYELDELLIQKFGEDFSLFSKSI